jgi:hypothetical protein
MSSQIVKFVDNSKPMRFYLPPFAARTRMVAMIEKHEGVVEPIFKKGLLILLPRSVSYVYCFEPRFCVFCQLETLLMIY